MKTALLIIDLQQDFTRDDGKVPACTAQIPDVIATINHTLALRNQQGELSAVISTQWSNPFVKLLTKNSVKPGSKGAQIDSRLAQQYEQHFVKTNKNIFTATGFEQWLQQHKVEQLIFSGLALEHCITVSVKAALAKHYNIALLNNGLASYKCENRDKSLLKLEQWGATYYDGLTAKHG